MSSLGENMSCSLSSVNSSAIENSFCKITNFPITIETKGACNKIKTLILSARNQEQNLLPVSHALILTDKDSEFILRPSPIGFVQQKLRQPDSCNFMKYNPLIDNSYRI